MLSGQGQLERDVRDPEERRLRELQAQRSFLALAERFLILHASKIVALMMFWAAMAQPGAIGWLLLGAKLAHCPPSTSTCILLYKRLRYQSLGGP